MLPRVLVITFDPVPTADGKSVRIETLLRALQGRYDVDVLTAKAGDLPHIELISSARVLRVPLGRGNLHAQIETFARAVRRQLHSDDYRVVHLCDPRVSGPVCELADERSFHLVYEPLSAPLLDLLRVFPRIAENEGLAQRLRAAERLCISTASVVVVSTEQGTRYLSTLGVQAQRTAVVPGGVDVQTFSSTGSPEGPIVAYVGELAPWQGLGTLLRAIPTVRESVGDVRFHLTGPCRRDHRDSMNRLVEEAGVEDVVRIEDAVPHPEVPARLGAARVVVVPTESDDRVRMLGPFPWKVAEALAVGRPVVLSRLPSHLEVARDGDEGVYFQPGRDDELAQALVRTLGDGDLGRALGRKARERVHAQFNLSRFEDGIQRVYSELVA